MLGGRGTFSRGFHVMRNYETVNVIGGIKVLSALNGKHNLPEESNTSSAYLLLDKNGNFSRLRLYDDNHYAIMDIDYHPERAVDPSGKNVLHYHIIEKDFSKRILVGKLPLDMYEKYKNVFIGVNYD